MTRFRTPAWAAALAAVSLALLAAAPQNPPAQTPPPQQPPPAIFRGGVETVPIYATVLDRYGEMLLNLQRDDFEVFDDGKKQTLTTFVSGLQPITAFLLVDTSASMTLNLELAQAAAEQVVIRMLPGDKARVGSFSDRIDLTRSFTSDRDALLKALREEMHIGNPTKLWDAVDETMADLAPLGGRRVIMLFTDGFDTASRLRSEDVLARAKADELMIYAVRFRTNIRGIQAELPLSPTASQLFSNDRSRNPPPAEALERITKQTGGGHFLLLQYDDVNTTFTRVMQELHHQYVLGFTPQRSDGKVHELEVRVKDRPFTTVRARRSYLAREKN